MTLAVTYDPNVLLEREVCVVQIGFDQPVIKRNPSIRDPQMRCTYFTAMNPADESWALYSVGDDQFENGDIRISVVP